MNIFNIKSFGNIQKSSIDSEYEVISLCGQQTQTRKKAEAILIMMKNKF